MPSNFMRDLDFKYAKSFMWQNSNGLEKRNEGHISVLGLDTTTQFHDALVGQFLEVVYGEHCWLVERGKHCFRSRANPRCARALR